MSIENALKTIEKFSELKDTASRIRGKLEQSLSADEESGLLHRYPDSVNKAIIALVNMGLSKINTTDLQATKPAIKKWLCCVGALYYIKNQFVPEEAALKLPTNLQDIPRFTDEQLGSLFALCIKEKVPKNIQLDGNTTSEFPLFNETISLAHKNKVEQANLTCCSILTMLVIGTSVGLISYFVYIMQPVLNVKDDLKEQIPVLEQYCLQYNDKFRYTLYPLDLCWGGTWGSANLNYFLNSCCSEQGFECYSGFNQLLIKITSEICSSIMTEAAQSGWYNGLYGLIPTVIFSTFILTIAFSVIYNCSRSFKQGQNALSQNLDKIIEQSNSPGSLNSLQSELVEYLIVAFMAENSPASAPSPAYGTGSAPK